MKSPIRSLCEIFSKSWNNIIKANRSTTIKIHDQVITINGKTYKPEDLSPEQRKAIKEGFDHMDAAFGEMGGAFKTMGRAFDSLRSVSGQKDSSH